MFEKGFCDVIPLDILDGAMEALLALALDRRLLVLTWVSLIAPNDARLLICERGKQTATNSLLVVVVCSFFTWIVMLKL
mgnify:CR=1 FL=1